MRSLTICLLLAFSFNATSSVLEYGTKMGSISGINIYETAKLKDGNNELILKDLGSGLRVKRLGFIDVRVYVAQIMGTDPAVFVRDSEKVIESVDAMESFGIRLEFVRDVSHPQMKEAILEALEKNNVDLSTPGMKGYLNALDNGGAGVVGKEFVVMGIVKENEDVMVYQGTNDKVFVFSGKPGLIKNIFSIWLGKPADRGAAKLKRDFLKGNR